MVSRKYLIGLTLASWAVCASAALAQRTPDDFELYLEGHLETITPVTPNGKPSPSSTFLKDGAKKVAEVSGFGIVASSSDAATGKHSGGDNPKVEPGKVKWHGSFAAACEGSKKSGKPVLLFQMMGKLDDLFC